MTRRLVARLDNVGDVLLAGPAVRAVAAAGDPVVFLAGPRGAAAAELLPGVGEVLVLDAPWVSFDAPELDPQAMLSAVERIAARKIDEAIILTSYHQSPLPLALLLRWAGVGRIAATSVDYPGRLLDIRHPYLEDLHEVEQSLSLCAAAGYCLPSHDDGRLRIDLPTSSVAPVPAAGGRTVVVHHGASVPARGLPPHVVHELVGDLTARGDHVVLTGSSGERPLAERVARASDPDRVTVAAGTTDLAELAALVAAADVAVCGNTGVAHVAAAVGTPVVQAWAPVVPAHRWSPWRVPHVLLGVLDIDCRGCRSRICPIPGQPCLDPFTAETACIAIDDVVGPRVTPLVDEEVAR
jgi:ADP-heptose:LPS heptosyltransferase